MNHQFRVRLHAGELLVGTVITLPAPEITELMPELGFDWLFVDTEHAPFDSREAQALLQAAGADFPCLVRVPAGEEVWIKKALDIGAAGVIVPQVNSPEQADRIVRLCKCPPQGVRGVGIARAHRYGHRFQEYVQAANQQMTVVIQIENVDAVRNVDAIVSVPGIDAVFIGPYDLSASLGRVGRVGDPAVKEAITRVSQSCRAAGVRLGAFGVDAKAVIPLIEQEFTLIAVGVDTLFLIKAAQDALSELANRGTRRS
jgi:2-dehydro-3-deoxyglucarate aldolase/4-hydroxy-2-oxoheptanedioate aldolase